MLCAFLLITRLYEVHPVVQMPYQQRAEGYVALGAYIDGGNASSIKFCYTQPVVMKYLPSVRAASRMLHCMLHQ